jgi:DNA-binding LacI/PurR family transcriptional regulator
VPAAAARPTIMDVARLAGVSRTTVSYVLNGTGYVSADKRARTEAAVSTLGYQPNALARGLSSRRASIIGILSSDPADEFVARICSGIIEEASRRDILVTISTHSPSPRAEELRRAAWGQASDGVIYIGSTEDCTEVFGALSQLCPAVLASEAPVRDAAAVTIDPRPAAQDLAQLVASCGHERVAVVAPENGDTRMKNRVTGLRDGLASVGIRPDMITMIPAPASSHGGREAADKIFIAPASHQSSPTAVMCVDDSIALGVIDRCRSLGMQVPTDISVTGFGDTRAATATTPRLTTAHMPAEWLGKAALEMLMTNPDRKGDTNPAQEIPASVVVGGTVHAPPGASTP